MSIDLTTKFLPYTDEQFSTESKKSLLTNQDFDWSGAHTVKVYKVSTSAMNDYGRSGPASGNWSRYGPVASLDATTEEMTLKKDTSMQLAAASALARQNREIVIPEVDKYTYGVMCTNAGHKPTAKALTATNIYTEILAASEALDNAEVPETGRVLVLTPAAYTLLKKCKDVILETNIGNELRLKGVIAMLDGMTVQKIPAVRLPTDFGFLVAHPCATVAPVKLEAFTVHDNPPGISGALVEGRIVYDAFTLANKVKALYYQSQPAATLPSGEDGGKG